MATAERPQIIRGNYPPLGTVEHLRHFEKASHRYKDSRLEKLYAFLSEHRIAESIAYFISDNDTPMRGQSPLRRSIDTRRLPGYRGGPIVHAEFYYNWDKEERYVFLSGKREKEDLRQYTAKLHLRNDLELDTKRPPEAHALGGPYPNKTFRIPGYANPERFLEYDESNPIIFLQVLGAATLGLQHYVEARDNS